MHIGGKGGADGVYGRQGWGSRVGCGAVNGGGGCGGWGWGEGSYGGRVLGAAGGQGWGKGNPHPPPPLAPFHNGCSSGPCRLWGCTQTPHCGSGGGGGAATKPLLWGRGFGGGGSQPHLPSVPHCPQGHPSLCPPQTRFVPLGRVGMGHNGGPMGLGGEMRRHGGMEPIWVRGHNSNGRLYGAGSGAGMLGELLPPPAL